MLLDARFWQLEGSQSQLVWLAAIPCHRSSVARSWNISFQPYYQYFPTDTLKARTARRVGAIGEAAPELPF